MHPMTGAPGNACCSSRAIRRPSCVGAAKKTIAAASVPRRPAPLLDFVGGTAGDDLGFQRTEVFRGAESTTDGLVRACFHTYGES